MLLKIFMTGLIAAAEGAPAPVTATDVLCKNGAPVAQKNVQITPYTIHLFKDVQLKPNKNNRNFSLAFSNKRSDCVLFSKEATLPAGDYTSDAAFAVYTACTDKSDARQDKLAYAFTKFDSLLGKDVLRIQCSRMKNPWEAERFAPQATDAKFALEDQNSGIRARVTTNE